MNQSKAKTIKRSIYGDDMSPRFRKYKRNNKTGQIVADPLRRAYKLAKKAANNKKKEK